MEPAERGVDHPAEWCRCPEAAAAGDAACNHPHQNYYLVTNAGTQPLGDGSFARRVWKAAQPRRPANMAA